MKTHFECGLNAFPDADYRGMTLRDYFAAKAMQGLMHNYHPCEFLEDKNYLEDISMASYQIANAMMKARDA